MRLCLNMIEVGRRLGVSQTWVRKDRLQTDFLTTQLTQKKTMEAQFQVFDMSLPFKGLSDILDQQVWPVIRPSWSGKKVVTKKFQDGEINELTLYHVVDDVNLENGMIVRVYEKERDCSEHKYDELIYMQVAHQAGCCSAVRAAFRNAIIYDYMPGQNVEPAAWQEPRIIRNIARALARLHWVDTDSLTLRDRRGQRVSFPRKPNLTGRMREVLNNHSLTLDNPEDMARAAELINLGELEAEIEFVEQYLEGLDLPTANTHDDFHFSNVLYDERTEHVSLIDHEMSGFHAPATIDLSLITSLGKFHRESMARWIPLDILPAEPESEEVKRKWLTAYLEQKAELETGSARELDQREVDLWFIAMQITDVLTFLQHNFDILMGLKRTAKPDRVAVILELYNLGRQAYYEGKPGLASLREKYLQMKSQVQPQLDSSGGQQ